MEHDLAEGDYGLAKQRLYGLLINKGYDADLLARAGQIAFEMHDLREAGRLWLTSSAEGERVDRAIDAFLGNRHRDPRNVLAQLPRAARLPRIEDYHAIARERIVRLGLQDAVLWKDRPRTEHQPFGRITIAGIVLLLIVIGIGSLIWFVAACVAFFDRIFS